jgi:hypothetical protein
MPSNQTSALSQKPLSNSAKVIKSEFDKFSPDLLQVSLSTEELKACNNDEAKKTVLLNKKKQEANIKNDKLKNVLIVVSLFAKKKYEDEYLYSLIGTIKNYFDNNNNGFKKISIYIAGLLQRHNFWNFTKKIKNAELIELLKDISLPDRDNVEKQLADILAKKFWHHAMYAENDFKSQCENLIVDNIPNAKPQLYCWDELTPISDKAKFKDPGKAENYKNYRQIIDLEYNMIAEEKSNTET